MREWLVIESSMKNAVFADDEMRNRKGYIPRDVAERLLGRSLVEPGRYTWFTREEGERMRGHPEWRDTQPTSREQVIDEAVRLLVSYYPEIERAVVLRHILKWRCVTCVALIRTHFRSLAKLRLPSD